MIVFGTGQEVKFTGCFWRRIGWVLRWLFDVENVMLRVSRKEEAGMEFMDKIWKMEM